MQTAAASTRVHVRICWRQLPPWDKHEAERVYHPRISLQQWFSSSVSISIARGDSRNPDFCISLLRFWCNRHEWCLNICVSSILSDILVYLIYYQYIINTDPAFIKPLVYRIPVEKEMATHSSVLAWRVPGTGEPGGLPSMGSHRVRHDWSDLAVYRIPV